jgi:GNAT superfamily N-acetyltransferase
MEDAYGIRRANDDDIALLVEHRLAMFRDMGWTDEGRLDALALRYAEYLSLARVRDQFTAWIAEDGAGPVGSVGLLWELVPPTVRNLSGTQAYVLALYVIPSRRRHGVATRLLDQAVTHARSNGVDVVSLHHSPAGRGLYERFGFVESPEMRLFTDPASATWAPSAPGHVDADDAD